MLNIGTNNSSLIAQTYLSRSNNMLSDITARLSSGSRIASAKDDRI